MLLICLVNLLHSHQIAKEARTFATESSLNIQDQGTLISFTCIHWHEMCVSAEAKHF